MQDVHTTEDLVRWSKADSRLLPLISEVAKSQDGDSAHDLSHLWRVAHWTCKLLPASVPREEAVAAALLHDLVNLPKNHPERAMASTYAAEKSKPLLKSAGFGEMSIARITDAIRDHSFSRGAVPASDLGKALQDADRLEALGAIGLMRVFATGARMGTKFFHDEDPWAVERERDDTRYSLDHFFTKLLKLPSSFHTSKGREEARRRAAVLDTFLDQVAEEIGVPRV